MKYKSKLKRIEKQLSVGEQRPVRIKVTHHSKDDGSFEKKLAIYHARRALNLISLDEPKVIFACADEELKQKFQNLSIQEAQIVLKDHGKH